MKPKLTDELADKALDLIKGGATNADVIAWLGVVESTFYAWLKDPKTEAQRKLSEGIKKAEVERKLWHLNKIHQAAKNGDWKASAWYLERRYPNEYARTNRVVGSVDVKGEPDPLTKSILETAKAMESERA